MLDRSCWRSFGGFWTLGEALSEEDQHYAVGGEDYFWDSCAARVGDGVSLVWRDVTKRHAAAQVQEQYRMVAENASDVVAQVGQDQSIVWVSPSVEPVLGWRPDEVIGQDIVGLTHPDDRPAERDWRERNRDGLGPAHLELRVLTGTGDYRWMSVTARQALAPDGSWVGRVVSLRDVQEQRHSRRALSNSQRRYKMLAENASDVVCEVDADAMITWMTPSVQMVLGWAKGDLIGAPVASLVHPEDLNADRGGDSAGTRGCFPCSPGASVPHRRPTVAMDVGSGPDRWQRDRRV